MKQRWLDVQRPVKRTWERLQRALITISRLDHVTAIRDSSLCFLIGRDSRQSHLQSAGCQPGERADDGGLREVGQRCECETWHGLSGACCVDSLHICLESSVFSFSFFLFLSLILVVSRLSSCWNGSVAPSPGCRTACGIRLWVKCRQSRRTSETTAVSTNHPRLEFTIVL